MEFGELAKSRYSVRKFSEQPIEDEKLKSILEAGRVAPTAKNNQPQRIYVLKSKEALEKINAITPCAFHAPVVLVVCAAKSEAWVNPYDNHDSAEMDASIVSTHMMLQASALGIGSTWVCWVDRERVKKEFSLPEEIAVYNLLPLGYAAEDAAPSVNHDKRKPLEETVFEA